MYLFVWLSLSFQMVICHQKHYAHQIEKIWQLLLFFFVLFFFSSLLFSSLYTKMNFKHSHNRIEFFAKISLKISMSSWHQFRLSYTFLQRTTTIFRYKIFGWSFIVEKEKKLTFYIKSTFNNKILFCIRKNIWRIKKEKLQNRIENWTQKKLKNNSKK